MPIQVAPHSLAADIERIRNAATIWSTEWGYTNPHIAVHEEVVQRLNETTQKFEARSTGRILFQYAHNADEWAEGRGITDVVSVAGEGMLLRHTGEGGYLYTEELERPLTQLGIQSTVGPRGETVSRAGVSSYMGRVVVGSQRLMDSNNRIRTIAEAVTAQQSYGLEYDDNMAFAPNIPYVSNRDPLAPYVGYVNFAYSGKLDPKQVQQAREIANRQMGTTSSGPWGSLFGGAIEREDESSRIRTPLWTGYQSVNASGTPVVSSLVGDPYKSYIHGRREINPLVRVKDGKMSQVPYGGSYAEPGLTIGGEDKHPGIYGQQLLWTKGSIPVMSGIGFVNLPNDLKGQGELSAGYFSRQTVAEINRMNNLSDLFSGNTPRIGVSKTVANAVKSGRTFRPGQVVKFGWYDDAEGKRQELSYTFGGERASLTGIRLVLPSEMFPNSGLEDEGVQRILQQFAGSGITEISIADTRNQALRLEATELRATDTSFKGGGIKATASPLLPGMRNTFSVGGKTMSYMFAGEQSAVDATTLGALQGMQHQGNLKAFLTTLYGGKGGGGLRGRVDKAFRDMPAGQSIETTMSYLSNAILGREDPIGLLSDITSRSLKISPQGEMLPLTDVERAAQHKQIERFGFGRTVTDLEGAVYTPEAAEMHKQMLYNRALEIYKDPVKAQEVVNQTTSWQTYTYGKGKNQQTFMRPTYKNQEAITSFAPIFPMVEMHGSGSMDVSSLEAINEGRSEYNALTAWHTANMAQLQPRSPAQLAQENLMSARYATENLGQSSKGRVLNIGESTDRMTQTIGRADLLSLIQTNPDLRTAGSALQKMFNIKDNDYTIYDPKSQVSMPSPGSAHTLAHYLLTKTNIGFDKEDVTAVTSGYKGIMEDMLAEGGGDADYSALRNSAKNWLTTLRARDGGSSLGIKELSKLGGATFTRGAGFGIRPGEVFLTDDALNNMYIARGGNMRNNKSLLEFKQAMEGNIVFAQRAPNVNAAFIDENGEQVPGSTWAGVAITPYSERGKIIQKAIKDAGFTGQSVFTAHDEEATQGDQDADPLAILPMIFRSREGWQTFANQHPEKAALLREQLLKDRNVAAQDRSAAAMYSGDEASDYLPLHGSSKAFLSGKQPPMKRAVEDISTGIFSDKVGIFTESKGYGMGKAFNTYLPGVITAASVAGTSTNTGNRLSSTMSKTYQKAIDLKDRPATFLEALGSSAYIGVGSSNTFTLGYYRNGKSITLGGLSNTSDLYTNIIGEMRREGDLYSEEKIAGLMMNPRNAFGHEMFADIKGTKESRENRIIKRVAEKIATPAGIKELSDAGIIGGAGSTFGQMLGTRIGNYISGSRAESDINAMNERNERDLGSTGQVPIPFLGEKYGSVEDLKRAFLPARTLLSFEKRMRGESSIPLFEDSVAMATTFSHYAREGRLNDPSLMRYYNTIAQHAGVRIDGKKVTLPHPGVGRGRGDVIDISSEGGLGIFTAAHERQRQEQVSRYWDTSRESAGVRFNTSGYGVLAAAGRAIENQTDSSMFVFQNPYNSVMKAAMYRIMTNPKIQDPNMRWYSQDDMNRDLATAQSEGSASNFGNRFEAAFARDNPNMGWFGDLGNVNTRVTPTFTVQGQAGGVYHMNSKFDFMNISEDAGGKLQRGIYDTKGLSLRSGQNAIKTAAQARAAIEANPDYYNQLAAYAGEKQWGQDYANLPQAAKQVILGLANNAKDEKTKAMWARYIEGESAPITEAGWYVGGEGLKDSDFPLGSLAVKGKRMPKGVFFVKAEDTKLKALQARLSEDLSKADTATKKLAPYVAKYMMQMSLRELAGREDSAYNQFARTTLASDPWKMIEGSYNIDQVGMSDVEGRKEDFDIQWGSMSSDALARVFTGGREAASQLFPEWGGQAPGAGVEQTLSKRSAAIEAGKKGPGGTGAIPPSGGKKGGASTGSGSGEPSGGGSNIGGGGRYDGPSVPPGGWEEFNKGLRGIEAILKESQKTQEAHLQIVKSATGPGGGGPRFPAKPFSEKEMNYMLRAMDPNGSFAWGLNVFKSLPERFAQASGDPDKYRGLTPGEAILKASTEDKEVYRTVLGQDDVGKAVRQIGKQRAASRQLMRPGPLSNQYDPALAPAIGLMAGLSQTQDQRVLQFLEEKNIPINEDALHASVVADVLELTGADISKYSEKELKSRAAKKAALDRKFSPYLNLGPRGINHYERAYNYSYMMELTSGKRDSLGMAKLKEAYSRSILEGLDADLSVFGSALGIDPTLGTQGIAEIGTKEPDPDKKKLISEMLDLRIQRNKANLAVIGAEAETRDTERATTRGREDVIRQGLLTADQVAAIEKHTKALNVSSSAMGAHSEAMKSLHAETKAAEIKYAKDTLDVMTQRAKETRAIVESGVDAQGRTTYKESAGPWTPEQMESYRNYGAARLGLASVENAQAIQEFKDKQERGPGGFFRRVLGGFGLMYMRSIAGIVGGGLAVGLGESIQTEALASAATGRYTPQTQPLYNPMQYLERIQARTGGPGQRYLTDAQARLYEANPGLASLLRTGGSAIAAYGATTWAAGMLGSVGAAGGLAESLGIAGATAGAGGFLAAAAPILGLAVGAGITYANLQGAARDVPGTAATMAARDFGKGRQDWLSYYTALNAGKMGVKGSDYGLSPLSQLNIFDATQTQLIQSYQNAVYYSKSTDAKDTDIAQLYEASMIMAEGGDIERVKKELKERWGDKFIAIDAARENLINSMQPVVAAESDLYKNFGQDAIAQASAANVFFGGKYALDSKEMGALIAGYQNKMDYPQAAMSFLASAGASIPEQYSGAMSLASNIGLAGYNAQDIATMQLGGQRLGELGPYEYLNYKTDEDRLKKATELGNLSPEQFAIMKSAADVEASRMLNLPWQARRDVMAPPGGLTAEQVAAYQRREVDLPRKWMSSELAYANVWKSVLPEDRVNAMMGRIYGDTATTEQESIRFDLNTQKASQYIEVGKEAGRRGLFAGNGFTVGTLALGLYDTLNQQQVQAYMAGMQGDVAAGRRLLWMNAMGSLPPGTPISPLASSSFMQMPYDYNPARPSPAGPGGPQLPTGQPFGSNTFMWNGMNLYNNFISNPNLSFGRWGTGYNVATSGIRIGGTGEPLFGMAGLQYAQQQQMFDFQGASIGITMRGIALQREYQPQFFKLQWQQMQTGFAQQREMFGLQKEQLQLQDVMFKENFALNLRQTQAQRGWTREDWAFNQESRSMQWGWKQEDFSENVRFMTGRDRRLAERQMRRETITYERETDQVERQKKRQEELWKLEDERFELQKKQHTESLKLQQEQMAIQIKYFKASMEQQERQFRLQQKYWAEQIELQEDAAGIQGAQLQAQKDFNDAVMDMQANLAAAQEMMALAQTGWDDSQAAIEIITEMLSQGKSFAEAWAAAIRSLSGGGGGGGSPAGPKPNWEGEDGDVVNGWVWKNGRWVRATAAGGATIAVGDSIVVNEQGQELFQSYQSGRIYPLGKERDPWVTQVYDNLSFAQGMFASEGQGTTVNVFIGGEKIQGYIYKVVQEALNG